MLCGVYVTATLAFFSYPWRSVLHARMPYIRGTADTDPGGTISLPDNLRIPAKWRSPFE